jgi:hypothetical protein
VAILLPKRPWLELPLGIRFGRQFPPIGIYCHLPLGRESMFSGKAVVLFAAHTTWPTTFFYTCNADDLIDAFKSGTSFNGVQGANAFNATTAPNHIGEFASVLAPGN